VRRHSATGCNWDGRPATTVRPSSVTLIEDSQVEGEVIPRPAFGAGAEARPRDTVHARKVYFSVHRSDVGAVVRLSVDLVSRRTSGWPVTP